MRIAIVSDIHGNLAAFEAILADLQQVAPDLVLHGGDLADAGSSPAEIVDRIRNLGWQGVIGNTDEMLVAPETLEEFARLSPGIQPVLPVIRDMAAATRGKLGEERLAWLRSLPRMHTCGSLALVHASPESPWRAPGAESSDEELHSVYAPLAHPVIVYGHIHRPFVRNLAGMTVINSGSVSLSYDGDYRASYLLVDDDVPSIRRIEYNLDRELRALSVSGLPHSEWIARTLATARPQMP